MAPPGGTVAELLEFLSVQVAQGGLTRSTADAYASAVRQVFETAGEDWERVEVRPAALDEEFARFARQRRGQYKDSTLQSYKSRLYKAVSLYTRGRGGAATQPQLSEPTAPVPRPRPAARPAAAQVITHQFPLRPGLLVTISLPTDLSSAEARRLTTFVNALATEP